MSFNRVIAAVRKLRTQILQFWADQIAVANTSTDATTKVVVDPGTNLIGNAVGRRLHGTHPGKGSGRVSKPDTAEYIRLERAYRDWKIKNNIREDAGRVVGNFQAANIYGVMTEGNFQLATQAFNAPDACAQSATDDVSGVGIDRTEVCDVSPVGPAESGNSEPLGGSFGGESDSGYSTGGSCGGDSSPSTGGDF